MLIKRSIQRAMPVPKFLGPLVENPTVEPLISAGFDYSPTEAALLGRRHLAVDIAVPPRRLY